MKVNNIIDNMKTGKRLFVLLGMVGLLLVFIVIKFMKTGDKQTLGHNKAAVVDVPDAEKTQMNGSKLGNYNAAEKIWEQNADMLSDDDLYQDDTAPEEKISHSTTADEIVKNIKEVKSSPKNGSSSGNHSSYKDNYRKERMREYYENTEAFVPKEQKVESVTTEDTVSKELSTEITTENIGQTATIRRSSTISSLDDGSSGFSSLSDNDSIESGEDYPFECMFVRDEKLRNGSRVSVRLLEDMVVGGVLIPSNTHLMAICSIGNRLELKVTSIEMNSKIYALGYEAYDSDGSKGIYCPDLNAQARKTAKSQGLSTVGSILGGRLGRLASTAVSTGISIAQSKNGEITVTVPSGYRFFIVKAKK